MPDYTQDGFAQLMIGDNRANSDCLPDDDIFVILRNLSMTNRTFFQSAKPTLDEIMAKKLGELLDHIVWGREEQARAMLESYPNLLYLNANATSEVGRQYNKVTPYELALYCGDTQMCEMMHEIFDKIDAGENARIEQYQNVFPNGVDAIIKEQKAYDFNDLIDAIHNASAEDVTTQLRDKVVDNTVLGHAINAFRKEFEEMSKSELHSNLKHLLEALRAYAEDKRIAEWERMRNTDKMQVFWRQVIGFVQLYLPECDKQAFHQGLNDVVSNEEQLTRKVDFVYDKGHSLHRVDLSSGCGFDFAGGPHECRCSGARRGVLVKQDPRFKNFCQTKTSNLKNLCSPRQDLRNHA